MQYCDICLIFCFVLFCFVFFNIVDRVVRSYSYTYPFKATYQYNFARLIHIFFQSMSQLTLMLLILEQRLTCYVDLWVTRITLMEHIYQK